MQTKFSLLVVILLSFSIIIYSQKTVYKDFKHIFNRYRVDGCFVLKDNSSDNVFIYNPEQSYKGYIPASTFKIPNALIALEEGVLKDTSQVIKWDGVKRNYSVWNKDQNLCTAIKYSCVWAFMKIADQIDDETYIDYLNRFDYGNKNIEGLENGFWLQGKFRISAVQQVEFLQRFYNNQLGTDVQHTQMIKDILIQEKFADGVFSGKTGGADIDENKFIMWFVGYIEKGNQSWFFAMNFISDDFNKTKNARKNIVIDVLKEMEVIND